MKRWGSELTTIAFVVTTMAFLAVVILMPDKPKRDKRITDDDAIEDVSICNLQVTDPPKWVVGRDSALKLCWLTDVTAPYAVPFDCSLLENCRG